MVHLNRSCALPDEVNLKLYEMDPEDIHLTCTIPQVEGEEAL